MFSLYIHIPFCSNICPYCDFNTYALASIPEEEYCAALIKDFEVKLEQFNLQAGQIETIYWGGGTPSILSPSSIAKVLNEVSSAVQFRDDIEHTIEINPLDLDLDKLQQLKDLGINRLSIGGQSLNNEYLKTLGRKHQAKDVYTLLENIQQVGFENYNLDLIFAVPDQSASEERVKLLQKDLDKYTSLELPHISAYELTIEKGTPFYRAQQSGLLAYPTDDLRLEMFQLVRRELKAKGYLHYEISNFAKSGFESKHNKNYWQRKTYIGIGAGAHGFCREKSYRYANLASYQDYLNCFKQGGERLIAWFDNLDDEDSIGEVLSLGLRTAQGVSLKEFKSYTSFNESAFMLKVKTLVEENFICIQGDVLQLTAKGQEVADSVILTLSQVSCKNR